MAWPFKNIADLPVDNWKEFKNLFIYQADAEEAAYFYTLNLVRQYQENVLQKRFTGFSTTERSKALRKMKAAMRLGQIEEARRYLAEYYRLGGSNKGLKSSMRNMNPLHGLSKEEQAQLVD